MQINLSLASDFLRHKLDDQTKAIAFYGPITEMGLLETIFGCKRDPQKCAAGNYFLCASN
jgi:hypothetical protein